MFSFRRAIARRVRFLLLAAAMLLAPTALAGAIPGAGLMATVQGPGATVRADQPVTVRVTLANPTPNDITVPAWETPARGVAGPIFTITRDGVPVPYAGMLAKRGDPAPGDLVAVPAGSSRSWDVDLAEAWVFTAGGTYTARFDSPAVAAPSVPTVLEVSARVMPPAASVRGMTTRVGARSITYVSCGSLQRQALPAALTAADVYAAEAEAYFSARRSGQRYVTWFGAHEPGRWLTVADHFDRIHATTSDASITFTCASPDDCGGAYAYVFASQPYGIYLCQLFWDAAVTGTNSRGGTLIHEISHFTVVGGTGDLVYGEVPAANLAAGDPTRAVRNADNHEYFAENTPAATDTGGAYTLSADSLDFGSVTVGTTTTRTITLTSTGGGPVTISAVAPSGAGVAISSDACSGRTLAASATCAMAIAFRPAEGGARTGTIVITSDAPAAQASITLTGSGVFPVPQLSYPAAVGTVGTRLSIAPVESHSGTPAFAIGAPLPPGLALDPATGVISGTPTTATPRAAYPISLTDAGGGVTATAALTIQAAPSRMRSVSVRVRTLITPTRLAGVAGLRVPSGARVTIGKPPPGLSRTAAGVRATRAGTYRLVITVVPRKGRSTSQTITLIVK